MKRKRIHLLHSILPAIVLAVSLTACASAPAAVQPTETSRETETAASLSSAPAPQGSASAGETEAAPAGADTAFIPGSYTGISQGRGGPIVIQADFSEEAVTDIRVISHQETYHVGDVPLERYPEMIVEYQSLDVDLVAGATISSVAALEAVRSCVRQAGGDPAALKGEIPDNVSCEDTLADIVVIGGGAAGMTAASMAAEAGKQVILLEKLGFLGGTSAYSIESFGASEAMVHTGLGTPMTSDQNYEAYVAANPAGDPEALRILADENGKAADWLWSIGAPLTVASGGNSAATSRETGKLGQAVTSALMQEAKKQGVDIRIENRAVSLLAENGAVTGVQVENAAGSYTIHASAVILATGGFGADNEMVSAYEPRLKGYAFSCSAGATGDGHKMAEAAGAQLAHMDTIRVNFTYYTDGMRVYYMGCLPNTGAIFLDQNGKRILNDQGGYGVGMDVVDQGGSGYMIFDQSMVDSIQDVREYAQLGIYESADTLEALAEKIGVDPAGLSETVAAYLTYVENSKDEEFGRRMLNLTFDEPPYYACKMTAHVQGTFGGIQTNTGTEVLDTNGNAIPGLYAAGECAWAGTNGANPMAVNIVFGAIAGRSAAEYAK